MLPDPIDERMDTDKVRLTLILGALREAGFYLQTAGRTHIDSDLIRTVAVDEAVVRFMGREMFSSPAEAASEALRHVASVGIERLLREKGYLR